MIARFERWGAWVKLDSPAALVALDHRGVRALGLTPPAQLPEVPFPIEAHVAVTERCGAGCEGCYLDARPDGAEPPRDELLATLDALAAAKVFTVAFGGGEPTLREDVGELAVAARARGMTPVLTTSGLGLTAERVERLRAFAQVNVSYDGASAAYAEVRGFDGARAAERAIEALVSARIPVGVNVVLTRSTFDALDATLARAKQLGACEAQLLRYKPAGRAASLDYLARRLSAAQSRALGPTLRALAASHANAEFRIRVDCALVPLLSGDDSIDPAALAAFGVFGCEAGQALSAVRVDGRVAPCSFAKPSDLAARDFVEGFASDPTLATWRAHHLAPPEPCASCALRAVCKGGCKVVASFVGGQLGPDPECPRVRAARGEASS